MDELCENCRYYLAVQTNYKEDGTCRFAPPTISLISEQAMGIWPKVKNTDWCGQFSPKRKQKKS
ncbi:hypothetical protein BerOc1_00498 [Pseudodesulfovibrio hydrargyri]|uniref:Uncharacterized protein n=1 Tax=Pseudodesulfovibrio hydrargyri TaxID=2125990 RepID=A0A1J5N8R8_9BACT|nr:hypothetical protein BerOc1_00498 [Pseudodesulfovibrio hydrargyri]